MNFRDKELEGSILSGVLERDTEKRLNVLDPKFFYFPISKWVYEKILENPKIDITGLADMKQSETGSMSEVTDFLVDGALGRYSFEMMVEQLVALYYKRELQSIGKSILLSLDTHKPEPIIQSAEHRLAELQVVTSTDSGSMNLAQQMWIKDKKDNDFMRTSISALNEIVDGLKRGRVWVLGGQSGCGKSFFGLQFTLFNVFCERNCLFFSTELTKAENFDRLLTMQKFFFDSKVDPEIDLASHTNLRLYDDKMTLTDIIFETKRQDRLKKVDLVVIDHIQDIATERGESLFDVISKAASDFKRLAIQNNIGILLISQLNKEGSFFGASKLNQVAHCSIKIEREENNNTIGLNVEKNRSGPRGDCLATFKTPECVFLSYAEGLKNE